MNQKIVDYLQENKDDYSKESLVTNLKDAGYNESEVEWAIKFVYGDKDIPVPESKQSSTINQQSKQQNSSMDKKVLIAIGVVILIGVIGVLGYVILNKLKNSNTTACIGNDCKMQDQRLNVENNSSDRVLQESINNGVAKDISSSRESDYDKRTTNVRESSDIDMTKETYVNDMQNHGTTSHNSIKCSLDDDGEGIQGIELEAYDEYGRCELDRNVEDMKFYRTLAGEEHEYVCEVEYNDSNLDKGEVDSGKGQCSYNAKNQVMEASYKGVECVVDYKNGTLQYASPRMNCNIDYATGDIKQEMLK